MKLKAKYLVLLDSVVICDDNIDAEAKSNDEESNTISTNSNEKNLTCKTQNFYILPTFLLIIDNIIIDSC